MTITTITRQSFSPGEVPAAPPTVEPPKIKKGRKPRGVANIRCPGCNKFASVDEGRVDDLELSVSGSESDVEVTIDGARLVMPSACCGEDYKAYDLSGNTKTVDHECSKIKERDAAKESWQDHCMHDIDGVRDCQGKDTGRGYDAYCSNDAGPICDDGVALKSTYDDLEAAVQSDGETWELEDENPDAEAYDRGQTHSKNRRTGKLTPIKNHMYAKSFRGITFTAEAKHELCGETETVEFVEEDAEVQAGDFEEA